MVESLLDQDEKVLEELAAQDLGGMTDRCKLGIKELSDRNEGAIIFLILSLNSRISVLEKALYGGLCTEGEH